MANPNIKIYNAGQYINDLLFVKEVERKDKNRRGLFECPFCKSHFESSIYAIVTGATKACGCQRTGIYNTIHGNCRPGKVTPEYRSWISMKDRCLNINNHAYPEYGGRGISIYPDWVQSFEKFLKYVGKRPSLKYSLDRYPDNNGNYEPGNVRWATQKQQCRNRRNSYFVTFNGIEKTLKDWCDELNLNYRRMWHRIVVAKYPVEKAFAIPIRRLKRKYKSNFIPHSFGVIAA